MRKLISTILICSVLLPTIGQVCIIVDFRLNQDFITELFCINKDKPVMACNGKCHLADQLKKTDTQEEDTAPASARKSSEYNYYTSRFNEIRIAVQKQLKDKLFDAYTSIYSYLFSPGIFHPPQFV